jgi:signal transduction histidine kinase
MNLKRTKFFRGFTRFRLMLTLGLAVVLPAAALIYFNYRQLSGLQRDKLLEAAIHRDFQEMLAISEKKINQKFYRMTEEAREFFPAPDAEPAEREKKLGLVLEKSPWLAHVFIYDQKSFVFHSQPRMLADRHLREESERAAQMYRGWIADGKMMNEELHKKTRHISGYTGRIKRHDGNAFVTTALFIFPDVAKDKILIGGICFDPSYLKNTFFPEMLNEQLTRKQSDGDNSGNRHAMIVFPVEPDMQDIKPLAVTSGWGEGKPEVSRKFDDVFRGLALGIKFQGTSVAAIGQEWVKHSFLLLGFLSVMIALGLVLTRHIVSKEMALARLKSDFVSNVSHELRTPLALIRLYAETLELGRITTKEKKQEYYRIVRKESERLTALINNILDFSRIEAGRKEYEFRETDIGELVRNTLESYRYQIEQQGFTFEQNIDPNLPTVQVDREAIARALVNLVNNALKYSDNEKFLGVNLYRTKGALKLEVADRGIGITRREQSKIFEKFYRTGDPLVHNTKGSGLGLSLVRHITQAHGGEVEVESTPGKGSKFTLSLPLAPGTPPPANEAAL